MLYLIFFCCVTLPCVSAALDYTTVHRGKLTFYGAGADSGGTCMYNNPRHSLGLPTVAVGNFGNAEKCGTCVYITPLGTGLGNSDFPRRPPFIAYVNNQCYECGEDNLDLAESSDGKWDIEWKFVDCPVSGSISLQLKSGSSIWHTEISARNFRNAISKVEYFLGGTWVNLARQPYNYFVLNSRVSLPVNVRLTSFFGNQQTLTLSDANYGVIEPGLISTSIQFPSGSSNPLPPPPPPPPVSPPPVSPGVCSYGTGTNNWWVEIVAPSSSDSVSVTCSDGAVYSCNYRSDMAKHICNGFPRECFGPRRATVNGRCCPLDGGCSSSSCGSYGTGTNNWWVEIVAPSASDRVSITCSDGVAYSCNYRSDMAKHICNGFSRECFGPRRVSVNGRCCPMDASCGSAATSDALTTSTNSAGELNYGAAIGIVLAACVVTGLVVGLITYRVFRHRNEVF